MVSYSSASRHKLGNPQHFRLRGIEGGLSGRSKHSRFSKRQYDKLKKVRLESMHYVSHHNSHVEEHLLVHFPHTLFNGKRNESAECNIVGGEKERRSPTNLYTTVHTFFVVVPDASTNVPRSTAVYRLQPRANFRRSCVRHLIRCSGEEQQTVPNSIIMRQAHIHCRAARDT